MRSRSITKEAHRPVSRHESLHAAPYETGDEMGGAGFTLIEVLLALAIVGVLLVLLLSSVRLSVRSWDKGGGVADASGASRMLVSLLSNDIGSAFPYLLREGGVKKYLFFGGGKDLGFVTTARRGGPGVPFGGLRWVYYSVREGGLTVREKALPAPDVTDDSGGRLMEVGPSVRDVSFEYLDSGRWEDAWDATAKKRLPQAVRVGLRFRDDRQPLRLTVPLGIYTGYRADSP